MSMPPRSAHITCSGKYWKNWATAREPLANTASRSRWQAAIIRRKTLFAASAHDLRPVDETIPTHATVVGGPRNLMRHSPRPRERKRPDESFALEKGPAVACSDSVAGFQPALHG